MAWLLNQHLINSKKNTLDVLKRYSRTEAGLFTVKPLEVLNDNDYQQV
jgi:phage antirepressor YoqD-like protein